MKPALVRLIGERLPGVVPEVLAVHPTLGWSLSRDGGPTLRSLGPPERLWTAWEGLVVRYAERLTDVLPAPDDWCRQLAAAGVPDSVQHEDLHSNNVCWTGSVETARIIDWGDASRGSPLGTMLATLNPIAFHAGVLAEGGPSTARECSVCATPTSSRSPRTPRARRPGRAGATRPRRGRI